MPFHLRIPPPSILSLLFIKYFFRFNLKFEKTISILMSSSSSATLIQSAVLPIPTHNLSVSPFLLNLSLDITDEDFGAEGDNPATAGEQFDGNVMNRPLVKAFFLMAYILVFVSCVVGNSMVLICIVCNRSMRTVTNFFLANLAIADLLVGIFCVCQNAVHFVLFAHGTWPFGKLLCHTYVYILHMIPNSSAGILVLLSVERFIAVLRPMLVHHLMTRSVLILCTLLVWTLSALMNIPYLIAVQYMEFYNAEANQHYGICTRRHLVWSDINVLQLVSTVNLMIWYVLPLTLLFSIYASIGLVLIRTTEDDSVARTSQMVRTSAATNSSLATSSATAITRQSIDSEYSLLNGMGTTLHHKYSAPLLTNTRKLSQLNNQQNGCGGGGGRIELNRTDSNCLEIGNGGIGHGNGNMANGHHPHIRRLPKIELVDSRRRVIRLCAVIVLAFAVLSLPRYIYLTWSVWREANAPRCLNCLSALVQPTTFLLMFFASGINPILYAFLSQRFRAAIRDTFSFRKSQEQRKEQMMLMLRNHRLSEQMERDALGYPISRTLSTSGSQNGASYRQKGNRKRSLMGQRPEESTIMETILSRESEVTDRERSCAF